jgi:hypothetical protein
MTTSLRMNTRRRVALAIGVPLALVLIGWLAINEIAWAGQGSYPVRLSIPMNSGAAGIDVDSGDLHVGPGAGHTLRLTGTAHYSLVRSTVNWTSDASGVSVRSRCPFPAGSCGFDSRITVPSGARATVRDDSGDVTVEGLTGPASIHVDSGSIQATGLSGVVSISDDSGDITGSALDGPRVVIEDNSGGIDIAGLASLNVSVSDDSGDITLTFSKVPNSVRVVDNSGNVTVVLPRGSTAYNVTAETNSGQRTVSVPTNSSSPHVITVHDDSGDVTVRN